MVTPAAADLAYPHRAGKRERFARLSYAAGVLPAMQWLRTFLRSEVRILTYHRVLDLPDEAAFTFDLSLISASAGQFREQMRLVKRRFHPLRFDELSDLLAAGRPVPPNAVIVTFDDGYDDNYRVAFPILRELDMPATFFVSTRHIDGGLPYAYDWLVHMLCVTHADAVDLPEVNFRHAIPAALEQRRELAADLLDQLKWLDDAQQGAIIARLEREWSLPRTPHADCRPMTWAELAQMSAAGMEIGSHGVSHRMLAKLPAADLHEEVFESKRMLEQQLKRPAASISYPVGGANAYNAEVIAAVKAAGYKVACTYIAGTNRLPLQAMYALNRLPVEREMNLAWFSAVLVWPEFFAHPTHLRIA
ncbi:MAG TPA: polysaccharide deacetylase family protein [Dokdonella sp.]